METTCERDTKLGAPLELGGIDDSALKAAIAELEELVAAFDPADVFEMLHVCREDPESLILCEKEFVSAYPTSKLVELFKPSPVFARLLATLRAAKRDLPVIDVLDGRPAL